jgi:replication factor C small subunit
MSEVMWVEKYRPRSLDEMTNQKAVISRLKGMLNTRDIPHLLFVGSPGIGKTATILAFAHDFYG